MILLDTVQDRPQLTPFSSTRSLATLRTGILTPAERWEKLTGQALYLLTDGYLADLYPTPPEGERLYVRSTWQVRSRAEASLAANLKPGQALIAEGQWLAYHAPTGTAINYGSEPTTLAGEEISWPLEKPANLLQHPWEIYLNAKAQVEADFALVTEGRGSEPIIDPHTRVYAPERIFLEPGVKIRAAILSAEDGPIYLGRNAQVQEGAMLHGTLALCEGATANMGVKLRGDNIIGPYCKVGGEVANSVLMGYSNKGHDGYLGNSVLGHWCNLGADTNTSNLKNNYQTVRLDMGPAAGHNVDTGQLFCGLLMGDHGKAGINTMFNTGTVVEVGANLYGGGYMPKYVPPFSWGGEGGQLIPHQLPQMLATEGRVMARRKLELSAQYEALLCHLYPHATLG